MPDVDIPNTSCDDGRGTGKLAVKPDDFGGARSGTDELPGKARSIRKEKEGVWFRDSANRYCLFRGANFASRSKTAPYLPVYPPGITAADPSATKAKLEEVRQALDLLADLGMNVVRLIVPWKALAGGAEDASLSPDAKAYLDSLSSIILALYDRGIFSIIDFHQDIAHEAYGGDGFPDWALAVDAGHPWPAAPRPDRAWQLRQLILPWPLPWLTSQISYDLPDGSTVTCNELVRNTYRSFWADCTINENGVVRSKSRLLTVITQTVAMLASGPAREAILGYEPFNEPHPAGLGKKCFEETSLAPFYESVFGQLLPVDADAFVFCEPRVDWNMLPTETGEEQGCPERPSPNAVDFQFPIALSRPDLMKTFIWRDSTPPDIAERAVFSFHFYDPTTVGMGLFPLESEPDFMEDKAQGWPRFFQAMLDAATSRSMIPFLTEFGGDHNWDDLPRPEGDLSPDKNQTQVYNDLLFQQIEQRLLNATMWVYELYYTDKDGDGWNGERFSLLRASNLDATGARIWAIQDGMALIVARPYPMRSSSLPKKLFFDSDLGLGAIVLTGMPVPAPTVIYVPDLFHYPDGFEVRATSSDLRWDTARHLLYWNPEQGDTDHQVILCKPGAFRRAALPEESQRIPTLPFVRSRDLKPFTPGGTTRERGTIRGENA